MKEKNIMYVMIFFFQYCFTIRVIDFFLQVTQLKV